MDGIFIVFVVGVYVFYFLVCVIDGLEIFWVSFEIIFNGNSFGFIFEESLVLWGEYYCSSMLVILDVYVGDYVFIRIYIIIWGYIYSSLIGWILFFGWLLYR